MFCAVSGRGFNVLRRFISRVQVFRVPVISFPPRVYSFALFLVKGSKSLRFGAKRLVQGSRCCAVYGRGFKVLRFGLGFLVEGSKLFVISGEGFKVLLFCLRFLVEGSMFCAISGEWLKVLPLGSRFLAEGSRFWV